MLAKNLEKLVSITAENYDEEKIDEEEHDLIIEAIEEADPEGAPSPRWMKMRTHSTWEMSQMLQCSRVRSDKT